MPGLKQHVSYWDSCIPIAWLQNEVNAYGSEGIDGIAEQIARFERQQSHLATSVLTLTEMLQSKIPPEVREKFETLFNRRNFHLVDVNRRIATLASEIRDFYQNVGDGYRTVSTPDAIHLATAIYFECNVFYTFDGAGKVRRNEDRRLLTLNGTIANRYRLTIMKPKVVQPALKFPERDETEI